MYSVVWFGCLRKSNSTQGIVLCNGGEIKFHCIDMRGTEMHLLHERAAGDLVPRPI